jgi:hypothetical protein
MGLKGGKNGVKADLRQCFPKRFCPHDTLSLLRDANGATRASTALYLDGNVILMQSPKDTFDAVTNWLRALLERAMATAAIVVVVFDEPDAQGGAKQYEQHRRDCARLKGVPLASDDLQLAPKTDAYGQDDLNRLASIHDAIAHRPARPRLIDALFCEAAMRLVDRRVYWQQNGEATVLLLDGIDPRAAARPADAPRAPALVGLPEVMEEGSTFPVFINGEAAVDALEAVRAADAVAAAAMSHAPEGEGDLKLAVLDQRVRTLATTLQCTDAPCDVGDDGRVDDVTTAKRIFVPIKLVIASTIDTDSIGISLLEHGRRLEACDPTVVSETVIQTVVAFKQVATQGGGFLALRVAGLFKDVCSEVFDRVAEVPLVKLRALVALVVGGWILSGCDYCELKGMRADYVLQDVKGLVRGSGTGEALLAAVAAAWSGDSLHAPQVQHALAEVACAGGRRMGSMPRARKATALALADTSAQNSDVLRASWVLSYWCGDEFADTTAFGFYFSPR